MEINPTVESASDVVEATDQDFEVKVIEKSHQVPVLVDFWAPWCGPCRVIGPVLEKLASQSSGRFELVKVNMDESPVLAQMLQIQSIPAVKLVIDGTIQDEFMGALPEGEVERFLEHNLLSEAVEDAVLGMRMLEAGDGQGAAQVFRRVLEGEPKNPVALIGMGQALLEQGDLDAAREFVALVNEVELEGLTERQQMEKMLTSLKARIYLTENAEPNRAGPVELATTFSQACQAALLGDYEAALEAFLHIVKTERKFNDDGGRKGMVAVFDLLPPNSPLTQTYRQKLSSILFA